MMGIFFGFLRQALRQRWFNLALAVLCFPAAVGGATYPVRTDPSFSDGNWVSFGALPGVASQASALALDTNGDLYVGGNFIVAGELSTRSIARWNGTAWSRLGSGVDGLVSAIAFDKAGNLYAGGIFETAGGVKATNIAKWNGSVWSALGSGIDGSVHALAVDNQGNLYAGGSFTSAGGVKATNIARWNGNSWSALDSGVNGPTVGEYLAPTVAALAFDATGNLYAGGEFASAGQVAANNIARWDGSAWSALGSGVTGFPFTPPIAALAFDAQGNLYVAGAFTIAGGVDATNIARWNGNSWSALGSGVNGAISSVAFDINGYLYAGGQFAGAGGTGATNIAKWDGGNWSGLGEGISGVPAMVSALACDHAGNLFCGGFFDTAGSAAANGVARWDGHEWSALDAASKSLSSTVRALAFDGPGNLYIGGDFAAAGSVRVNFMAKWDGSFWSPLGAGLDGAVTALLCDTNNNLYAGGWFTSAGGVSANCVAKWDGHLWSALDTGVLGSAGSQGFVSALAMDNAGNLYVGGGFTRAGSVNATNVAKWDGHAWSALGSGLSGGSEPLVSALACDSNGNVYAGGVFTESGGVNLVNIGKWDGSHWSSVGSGIPVLSGVYNPIHALRVDTKGNLYVGGSFSTAGGMNAVNIALWNGRTWAALGTGLGVPVDDEVQSLAFDPFGNLYAAGQFHAAGEVTARNIAQWNGQAWSSLGSGLDDWVLALSCDSYGNLYAGGEFLTAGTKGSAFLAKAVLAKPAPNELLLNTSGSGNYALTFLGTAGRNYALELAASLAPTVHWLPQTTNMAATNSATTAGYVIFTNLNGLRQAYYRTRLVP
jgi:hypothetical protein